MNLDIDATPTIMCKTCEYVWIYFGPKRRGKSGGLVPLEKRTGNPHDCDFSEPYYCNCGELIYQDRKILSPTGRRIPLNHGLDTYHYCDKQRSPDEVRFLKNRGLEA
jgi:hypothetical protein